MIAAVRQVLTITERILTESDISSPVLSVLMTLSRKLQEMILQIGICFDVTGTDLLSL